jgi:hypothetical protein
MSYLRNAKYLSDTMDISKPRRFALVPGHWNRQENKKFDVAIDNIIHHALWQE